VIGPGTVLLGVTQSGETADTAAAMRLARERGAAVIGVTNVAGVTARLWMLSFLLEEGWKSMERAFERICPVCGGIAQVAVLSVTVTHCDSAEHFCRRIARTDPPAHQ
jgi:fructoselysine-6-P-deglycase FrlB-like protein